MTNLIQIDDYRSRKCISIADDECLPFPVRTALWDAMWLRILELGRDRDAVTPALDDAYGRLWPHVPRGSSAMDVIGKGFSSCVKPDPDQPSPTLMKTQTGRGFATTVHPFEPRALSIREAAMIGSYPPAFRFTGNYQDQWARIGNSVPPLFMQAIAHHVATLLTPVSVLP